MKSTGLFGKNSGRVGGVVYSNYRGEQVVRTYQPKVNNPSTARQVEQRAKFKLVSQVGASLGREIALSFVPNVAKETPRNAWIKETIKKVTYDRNATLEIEDVTLTNSRLQAITDVRATPGGVTGAVSGVSANARVRLVQIGYAPGGEIVLLGTKEEPVTIDSDDPLELSFAIDVPVATNQYANQRALVYVYDAEDSARQEYGDYYTQGTEAILDDYKRFYGGRLLYSKTHNVIIPQNV